MAAMLLAAGGAWAAALPGPAYAQDVPATPPVEPAPQEAPDRFFIAAFDVSGATKLTDAEIERLIYPYLGPDRSNQDVVAARKALQDAYSAKGYEAVLVDVPIQPSETFAAGIVQIAVNETPVGRVRVTESRYHSLRVVREQIPSLVEGQPLDLKALQREVADANRYPDRIVDPLFRPGQVPGTIDVDLKVEDSSPFHASVELNNDNSPNTRALRAVSTLRYTDLWGLGHTASITTSFVPQATEQSSVVSLSYNAPLLGTPWSFLLYGYTSNSDIAALGGVNVLGNGTQVGLRAVYRLPSDTVFQQIGFGPDFKAFDEQLSLNGVPVQPIPIRYVPLTAEYTLAGSTDTTSFGLTFSVTAGLRVVEKLVCFDLDFEISGQECPLGGEDGTLGDQFQGRTVDARENFVRANLDMNYSLTMPEDAVLALRFAGQLSDSPLVTNEQFAIGGTTSVRGYFVSEAIGDDGFVYSAEVQSPDFASLLGKTVDELRFFAFGDVGYTRVRRPADEQQSSFDLAGVGAGLRFRASDLFAGEFLIGVPVTDGPTTDRGDPRYSFSIRGEF